MARTIELDVKVDGIDKVNSEIGELELKLQEMKSELEGVREGSPHFDKLSQSISQTEEQLRNLTETVGDAAEEQITLNQQIGEGEDKLMLMAQAGDTSSEAYKKLVAEVGNMKRIQMETNIQIDNAAKGMTGRLLVGIQRISTAYQVGMAATQMFGVESEKAQEIMARLQAVMAFTQGLDQLKQLTVGMNLFGVQGKLALSGIQKAIVATGIGALVVAVGLLVAYWDDIMELTVGISSELNDQLDTQKESVKAKEGELKAITASEAKLKLQGKTEREILEMKMAATQAIIEEQKLVVEFQKQKSDLEIKAYERNQQIAEDIIRGVLELNAMVLRALAAPLDLLIEAANTVSEVLGFGELTTFRINDAITDMIDLSSEWASTMLFDPEKKRKEAEEEIKIEEDKLNELENQYAQFQLQIQSMDKETSEKAQELARQNREKYLEILQSRLEKEREVENRERMSSIENLTGMEREIAVIREESFQIQRQLLEESVSDEISLLNEKFVSGKISETQYREERTRIILDAETKLGVEERKLFDLNQREREKKEEEIRRKYQTDATNFFNDVILSDYQKELAAAENQFNTRKSQAEEFRKSGLLSEEQYTSILEKLTQDRADKLLDIEKKKREKEKEEKQKALNEDIEIIKSLGSVMIEFAGTLGSGFSQVFSNLSTGFTNTFQQLKTGFSQNSEEFVKEVSGLVSGIVSSTVGVINGLFSILSEERNRNLEEDLNRATEIYNEELSVLDTMLKNGMISEQEYNKRKYAADLKKFQDEEKLKKSAFEADKGMRIGQAIMAGAQGAVAAFAGAMQLGPIFGPPVGAALAGAVAALTALQIGIISGQEYKGAAAPGAPTSGGLGGVGGVTIPAPQPDQSTLFGQPFEGSEGGSTQTPGSQQMEKPVRAYVLEADISQSQNLISTLEQRALVG